MNITSSLEMNITSSLEKGRQLTKQFSRQASKGPGASSTDSFKANLRNGPLKNPQQRILKKSHSAIAADAPDSAGELTASGKKRMTLSGAKVSPQLQL